MRAFRDGTRPALAPTGAGGRSPGAPVTHAVRKATARLNRCPSPRRAGGGPRHVAVQSRRFPARVRLGSVARPGATGLGSVSPGSQKAAFRVMLLTADGESCSAAVNTALKNCWGNLQTVRLLKLVRSWWLERFLVEGAPGDRSSHESNGVFALRVPLLSRGPSEGMYVVKERPVPAHQFLSTSCVRASS